MDMINLNSFLKFGYFLNYINPRYKINLTLANPDKYKEISFHELVDLGIQKYKNAIFHQYERNKENVVPLSGGLDSRAILATLMEMTDAGNIFTYTFGTPGTYDYEIANKTARKAGTKHKNFDLENHTYTDTELVETAKRFDGQTLLFYHPPLKQIDEHYGNSPIWSGAIIDVLFGRHYHKKKADNLEEAILNTFEENAFVKSIPLNNVDPKEFFIYVEFDNTCKGKISYEHCLDLRNRQVKYIAPQVLYEGMNFKVLFTDDELTSFALSIDQRHNEHQFFYKKMLLKAFPEIYKTGYAGYNGLSLNCKQSFLKISQFKNKVKKRINRIRPIFLNKNINFFDFNKRLFFDDEFKKTIYGYLMDLEGRKIIDWINYNQIWKDHFSKKENHTNAIVTLASLELILKAGKEI